MRITIFGLTISSSWGNGHATPYRAIIKALHARGHRVTFYEKDVEYYALRRDFISAEYCDLVLYRSWDEVRTRAMSDAAQSEVVMTASYCPEGARINDEVLDLGGPICVYYDLDAPVTLKNLEIGDVEYLHRDQLSAFDLVLSWTGGRALADLEHRWGARLVRPLFGCVDPDVYHRVPARDEFECALSYMGTYASDRQHKVDELFLEPCRRRADLNFLLAGTLYPWQWKWPGNVRRFDHVSPADHPALYCSSRLALNITRREMAATGWCPSGRFFEAAACGTPIITDWWEGLDHFFEPGRDILVAGTADDVVEYLAMTDQELHRIAERARQRTLDEHTGERRAEELLRFIEQAAAGRHAPARVQKGTTDTFLEAA